MRRFCAGVLAALLLCALVPGAMPPVRAAGTKQIVRVAYPIQAALTDLSEDGDYQGYLYEYLQEIAQYTGWSYEFVQVEGDVNQQLSTLLDRVRTGEVDLMCGILYQESMAQDYTYSAQSLGTVETTLQTTIGRTDVGLEGSEERPARVAVLRTTGQRIGELEEFAQINHLVTEYVLCGSVDEQVAAVENGEADMLLNTSWNYLPHTRTLAGFAPKLSYVISGQDGRGPELIRQLDGAVQAIQNIDPDFSARLQKKYLEPTQAEIHFSREEQAYINAAGPIYVGMVESRPPYEYIDPDTGKLVGIDEGLLRLIEGRTGLRFERVAASSQERLLEMAAEGRVDVVTDVTYHYTIAERYGLALTRPFMETSYVMIAGPGVETGRPGMRLAMSLTSAYEGPTVGIPLYFDSMGRCVEAVNNGQADYTYVDSNTAQYYANLVEYWDLQQIPSTYTPRQVCLGLVKPADPLLLKILNKAILSISSEEVQGLVIQSTLPERRISFVYYLREYPEEFLLGIAAVFAVLLALLYQRVRSNQRLKDELNKRLRIYRLSNDQFFEYDYRDNALILISPSQTEGGVNTRRLDCAVALKECGQGFLQTVRGGMEGESELYDLCKDGEYHWLRVTKETIYNAGGRPEYVVGRVNLIDQEKEERKALEVMAQNDGLTGLFNAGTTRRKIEEKLAAESDGRNGALLLLDLDYFKRINDQRGHLEGDRALTEMAALLRQRFGADGIVGRVGGDEFEVYLDESGGKEALCRRCAELCAAAREICMTDELRVTISLGVVLIDRAGGNYDELFQIVDQTMYQAKRLGRDGFQITELSTLAVDADSGQNTYLGSGWLDEEQYQTVLRATHLAAFEFDPASGRQRVSPFIGEYIGGNYDGRLLSQVMIEDGIIHPDDIERARAFRTEIMGGELGEMTLRLKLPSGEYHWFKLRMRPYERKTERIFVGVFSDVDEEMHRREALRYRAEYDDISGIYNKNHFFDMAAGLLEKPAEGPYHLLRFDVDRFKLINETYSVEMGDRVLRYIGEVLGECTRDGELYARLGNDVFAMLVRRSRDGVLELVEEIEEQINSYPLDFKFVLSAGVVEITGVLARQPVNVLCDCAAMAQRTVKGNYINRVAFYDNAMRETLRREHQITNCMGAALESGEFQIYFQPKFNIQTRQIIGAEVLSRWVRDGTDVSPGEYIPLFERNGFVLRLDEYNWEETCKCLRRWMDEGRDPRPLSVNVSRAHLYDLQFCDKILDLTERYGIPPRLLELEITESLYAENPEMLCAIMERLHEKGFLFSMDDFGNGYSSLNVLKDIPVDVVKMDLQFLRGSRRGEQAGLDVLRATIRLIQSLCLPIVVEGVETRQQEELLLEMGCVLAQGYYYAKPMTVQEYERLAAAETEEL